MAIIAGDTDVLEQPKKRVYSSDKGYSTIRTWMGPIAAINAYIPVVQAAGATDFEVTSDGPSGTISATFPDAQDAALTALQSTQNITWELLGNDLEKDLRTHVNIINQSSATQAQRTDLEAAKLAIEKGGTGGYQSTWYTGAQNYWKLRSQGVESWPATAWVLRKSIKVANDGTVQASLSNVNKVESPSGVPTTLFSVPTDDGQGNLEWLKKPPRVIFLGRGKYSIEQEWWGATRWSNTLYGGTGSP